VLRALNELPKPLIGRVNGAAYGGGVGLVSVCDAVIASSTARFGLTETRLGLIPATISPYVLARIGEGPARSVFFSARIFDAEEARSLRLVTRVATPEALDAAVEAEVAPYLATAPGAVAAAKRLARSLGPRIDTQVIEDTIARLADTWETPEAREGIAAFFDKRPAPWVR
jgi:methylglutaconyl-CoA hydratase